MLTTDYATAADVITVAFGSCLRQWKPAPVLETVSAMSPDAFIFAGDNVYTDTGFYRFRREPDRIAHAYKQLAAKPEYQSLKNSTTIFATWDDHDYGRDNAGAEYPWKEEAKRQFIDFYEIPSGSELNSRAGIYSAHYLGQPGNGLQILLLDTRSFRGPLQEADEPDQECPRSRLVATTDSSATLLGDDQWRWLAGQLEQPAALRLIVSSIQVIPDGHCYEKWGNFPHERQRLIKLIRDSDAMRTILLSGDRHLGEISVLREDGQAFPLYEITASGLNSAGAGKGESNPFRVTDDNVRTDHFGSIRFHQGEKPHVVLGLHGVDGALIQQYVIDYASWLPIKPAAEQ